MERAIYRRFSTSRNIVFNNWSQRAAFSTCRRVSIMPAWQYTLRLASNNISLIDRKRNPTHPPGESVLRKSHPIWVWVQSPGVLLLQLARVCPDHRVGRVLSFYSSRRNWDSPDPSPAGEYAPPPFGTGGRGTLAGEKGGGRVPILTRDIHCGTLYIYVLCGPDPPFLVGGRENSANPSLF